MLLQKRTLQALAELYVVPLRTGRDRTHSAILTMVSIHIWASFFLSSYPHPTLVSEVVFRAP